VKTVAQSRKDAANAPSLQAFGSVSKSSPRPEHHLEAWPPLELTAIVPGFETANFKTS
jgi:hypothetical protein